LEQSLKSKKSSSGSNKKAPQKTQVKTKEEDCDSKVTMENIEPMSKAEISGLKYKKLARFLVSCLEFCICTANAQGSQSTIVHYCVCLIAGQTIFRFFELLEHANTSSQMNSPLYNIQSTSMLVFFTQLQYMGQTATDVRGNTNNLIFYHQKLEVANSYAGELCDLMAYFEEVKMMVLVSFLFGVFLKFYNMYFKKYLEIHILAKQRNSKVADVIKRMYFEFYTLTLRQSEKTRSFISYHSSTFHNIIAINYIIFLLMFVFNNLEDA